MVKKSKKNTSSKKKIIKKEVNKVKTFTNKKGESSVSNKIKIQYSNSKEFVTLFTEYDIYLFKEGKHFNLYEKLGAHIVMHNNKQGVYFAVYAPNASYVSLISDFNNWDAQKNPMNCRWDERGIWEIWIEGFQEGKSYKYFIQNKYSNQTFEKIDPFGFFFEIPPKTASIVKNIENYQWKDKAWVKNSPQRGLGTPISIYEVHLGSWKRKINTKNNKVDFLTYKELAKELISYVKEMGFTHIELLPITEHPFYPSWGYQSLGYFAPTSRYGKPHDFMYFIDQCHQNNIGVILDFVPSHFPCDYHGLFLFDGGNIFEYPDPTKQIHPDWKSAVFNYDSPFVKNFLISSALFFLDKYHIDGLRIDAVASMLYLDYSRNDGEWFPNVFGGRENLEAINFLQIFNETIFHFFPNAHVIAEESTAWGGVSKPVYLGGLGFDLKWMMGWMHDVLNYLKKEPIHRKYHHNELTFSFLYFNTENFLLPLSHDEVVHGKGSLISRMPGDYWQKFANLRLLFCYQYFHPGAKLIFMGGEFAQFDEWKSNHSLDWHLLEYDKHKQMQNLIKELNSIYKKDPILYKDQFTTNNIDWLEINDYNQSIISFIRKDNKNQFIIIIGNFTPIVRHSFKIGVPKLGEYVEIFNSDDKKYGGSGVKNKVTNSHKEQYHSQPNVLEITIPPLACIALKLNK